MQEEKILEKARRGCNRSFDQLIENCRPELIRYASRIVREDEAEDLVQESTIKAYLNLGRFRGDCPLKFWLFKVMVNHHRDKLKKQCLPERAWPDHFDIPDPNCNQIPDRALHLKELAADLEARISQLPKEKQEVFVGFFVYGVPQKALAIKQGCSASTVGTRCFHARKKLATRMRKWR